MHLGFFACSGAKQDSCLCVDVDNGEQGGVERCVFCGRVHTSCPAPSLFLSFTTKLLSDFGKGVPFTGRRASVHPRSPLMQSPNRVDLVERCMCLRAWEGGVHLDTAEAQLLGPKSYHHPCQVPSQGEALPSLLPLFN